MIVQLQIHVNLSSEHQNQQFLGVSVANVNAMNIIENQTDLHRALGNLLSLPTETVLYFYYKNSTTL